MDMFEQYYKRLMTENQYIRPSGRFNTGKHTDDTKELLAQSQTIIAKMGERTPDEIKAEVEALNAKLKELYGAVEDQTTDNPGQYNSKKELATGMTGVNQAYQQYQQAPAVESALTYLNSVRDLLIG